MFLLFSFCCFMNPNFVNKGKCTKVTRLKWFKNLYEIICCHHPSFLNILVSKTWKITSLEIIHKCWIKIIKSYFKLHRIFSALETNYPQRIWERCFLSPQTFTSSLLNGISSGEKNIFTLIFRRNNLFHHFYLKMTFSPWSKQKKESLWRRLHRKRKLASTQRAETREGFRGFRQPSFAASPLLLSDSRQLHFQLFRMWKQTVINIYEHVCGVWPQRNKQRPRQRCADLIRLLPVKYRWCSC